MYTTTVSELYTYTYDHAGRVLETKYKLGTDDEIVLSSNSYDELGRLIEKKRHNGTDTESFEYNICNWTTKIKSGAFEENLFYTNIPSNVSSVGSPYYNGNISYRTWKYNGVMKGYQYNYDNLNRFVGGYAYDNNELLVDYQCSEWISYDKMGNITNLNRSSKDDVIDALNLYYNGNQLIRVYDDYGSLNQYSMKEYQDKSSSQIEFCYDVNGNMTKDLDRDIVTIKYNLLNLPDLVQFKNGNQIVNKYDASGRKLKTEYYTMSTPLSVPLTDGEIIDNMDDYTLSHLALYDHYMYVDNFVYRTVTEMNAYNVLLDKIYNTEGYKQVFDSQYFCYYRKDHLGNNREVWKATNNTTIQRTQYYPSGLPMAESLGSGIQDKKYNGKEFIEMHGYDSYDYGARTRMGAVPVFTSVDPLCEKYYSISPYVYCLNNPVKFVDPDGKKVVYFNGYLGFGSPVGGKPYWNTDFIRGAAKFFKDTKTYFTNIDHNPLSTASERQTDGYEFAKQNYNDLTKGMKKDEPFRFIGHSMGSAEAAGAKKYLEEKGWNVTTMVLLNSFQSDDIEIDKTNGTIIVDYQNTNDPVLYYLDPHYWTATGEVKNADFKIREESNEKVSFRHRDPIDSGETFWNNLVKKCSDSQNLQK